MAESVGQEDSPSGQPAAAALTRKVPPRVPVKKAEERERSFRWVPPPTFEIYKKNGKEKLD